MDSFKKFIRTDNKSPSEIKEEISALLSSAKHPAPPEETGFETFVGEISSENSPLPEKIPPRLVVKIGENMSQKLSEIPMQPAPDPVWDSPDADEDGINFDLSPEISENSDEKTRQINEKILEMRRRSEDTRNGYKIRRCAEVTFLLQGEFAADIEDDYEKNAFFAAQQPVYSTMTNSQLRTYFTRRAEFRRGIFRPVDKSYALLYIYELLNKIGENGRLSSSEAFSRLFDIRQNGRFPYLNSQLDMWLCDFCAHNRVSDELLSRFKALYKAAHADECPARVTEFLEKNFENKLEFLADISAYDIRSASFYASDENNRRLLDGALRDVLHALENYFGEFGLSAAEALLGRMRRDFSYTPFCGAMVNSDTYDGFAETEITPARRYCVKRGEPSLETFVPAPSRGVIGFVLKAVEAELRIATGFGRRLTLSSKRLEADIKNNKRLSQAVLNEKFPAVINLAVRVFCAKNSGFSLERPKKPDEENYVTYTAPSVTIDVSKLAQIRENSEKIARRLMIEDEEFSYETAAQRVSDDDFSDKISSYKENFGFPAPDGEFSWDTLKTALTPSEKQFLAEFYSGDPARFCRENGLFFENICEEINEKALAHVGDIILENSSVIEDYTEDVRGLLT